MAERTMNKYDCSSVSLQTAIAHNCAHGVVGHQHTTPPLLINRTLQRDPTRTLTLRNNYAKEMDRRFNALKRIVVRNIVDLDVFGLIDRTHTIKILADLPPRVFEFRSNEEKVREFMRWLKEHLSADLVQIPLFGVTGF